MLRSSLDVGLTDAGVAPDVVLAELASAVDPGLVATPGPRFFGFVIGGALPARAADWLASAWDQNAGLYVASPAAAAVVEEVARRVAARPARPAADRERRLRHRRPDGQLHRRWRPPVTRVLRRRGLGRRGATGCRARRAIRVVVGDEAHVTDRPRAAAARPRRRRAIERGAGRRPGADARRTRSPARSPSVDGPDDRLRAGRQRQHRRVRPARTRSPTLADAARRLAARRRRVRAVGRGEPAAAARSSRGSSAPTRGRPTRTSGSTCPTTAASRSSRDPGAHRRRDGHARGATSCRSGGPSATRSTGSPSSRGARAGSRSTPRCARSAARGVADAGRALLRAGAAVRRAAGRRAPASRSSTTSCSTRCWCASLPADGDADDRARGRRARPARRHLLAGRHHLARAGRDADLGVELVDDRGRRRPLRGRSSPRVRGRWVAGPHVLPLSPRRLPGGAPLEHDPRDLLGVVAHRHVAAAGQDHVAGPGHARSGPGRLGHGGAVDRAAPRRSSRRLMRSGRGGRHERQQAGRLEAGEARGAGPPAPGRHRTGAGELDDSAERTAALRPAARHGRQPLGRGAVEASSARR